MEIGSEAEDGTTSLGAEFVRVRNEAVWGLRTSKVSIWRYYVSDFGGLGQKMEDFGRNLSDRDIIPHQESGICFRPLYTMSPQSGEASFRV